MVLVGEAGGESCSIQVMNKDFKNLVVGGKFPIVIRAENGYRPNSNIILSVDKKIIYRRQMVMSIGYGIYNTPYESSLQGTVKNEYSGKPFESV